MQIEFQVTGKPQGKARPRFSYKTHVAYTPKSTKDYEQQIAEAYTQAGGKCLPADVYVGISIEAFFQVPQSWTKSKKIAVTMGTIKPTVKPDVDNIIKIVLDGLNGTAYADDKQVIHVSASKKYTQGTPMVMVYVWEVKE